MNEQSATQKPQDPKTTETPPDPQTSALFYARAGQSGDELRKTLLTLSVGAVGFFFVMLTGERAPALLGLAWLAVFIGLLAFAVAIVCALLAWYYAGRDFDDKAHNGAMYQGTNHNNKKACDSILPICFGLGVLASYVYFMERITTKP